MDQQQALGTARRLVEEAVEIAGEAGIEAREVVALHCREIASEAGDDRHRVEDVSGNLVWLGVPVVVDDQTTGLFEMSQPDDDPAQAPAFRVTRSIADFVRQDFARYLFRSGGVDSFKTRHSSLLRSYNENNQKRKALIPHVSSEMPHPCGR